MKEKTTYYISIENGDGVILLEEDKPSDLNNIMYEVKIFENIQKKIHTWGTGLSVIEVLKNLEKDKVAIFSDEKAIKQQDFLKVIENSNLINKLNELKEQVKELNSSVNVFQLKFLEEVDTILTMTDKFKEYLNDEKRCLLESENMIDMTNFFEILIVWNDEYNLTESKKIRYYNNINDLLYVAIHQEYHSISSIFSQDDKEDFLAELRELKLKKQIETETTTKHESNNQRRSKI